MEYKNLDNIRFEFEGKKFEGLICKDKDFVGGYKIYSDNRFIEVDLVKNIEVYQIPPQYKNEDREIKWDSVNFGKLMCEYPKAFNKFLVWRVYDNKKNDGSQYHGGFISACIRFFEINDVLIEIELDCTSHPKFAFRVWNYTPEEYVYDEINHERYLYYTRLDAQIEAIVLSFGTLEKKL